ncbi:replication protein A 70 kDa DNA-binding subunit A-like [Raphanus sativus]|uniref:Replication protein A 70 kDa DNA-binding subunit A-like n=1 Tax=Raphanus sativus TaxID=3726 RepID=A0A9W3CJQ7_RAPSA|nr:replication protein A 70 kDa DNA-binding subunit A-like [Raphanus sativus]
MVTFDQVSALKPFKTMWRIRVKIIRLWKQYSARTGESIEMVLVDSSGDKIHATVTNDLVSNLEGLLYEGCSKILINFVVAYSYGSYRPTNHAYKIQFLPLTRVRPCGDLPLRLTGFQPVHFMQILDGRLNTDFLVDVIGEVVEVSPLEIIAVNGKDTQRISCELRNEESVKLSCVLWGKCALDVIDAIQLRRENSIICVLRFVKIRVYKEDRSIENAYKVSYIAINPEMHEVIAFQAVLPKDALTLAIVEPKPWSRVSMISENEDFFIHTPRKTIAEVLNTRNVERCILMCTIAAVDSDMGWYYLSCKVCATKVLTVPNDNDYSFMPILDGGYKYYCTKCKIVGPKLLPRYNLHLVVLDNTSNTKLHLSDSLSFKLLHQPCVELTGKVKSEIQEPSFLPSALTNLVGKTYLFKILIEKDNYLYKHETFKVENDHVMSPSFLTASQRAVGATKERGSSSDEKLYNYLTPAKRSAIPIKDFVAEFEEMNETKVSPLLKVKKEESEVIIHKYLTPAKRSGIPIKDLLAEFDEMSETKVPPALRIKKEESDLSG